MRVIAPWLLLCLLFALGACGGSGGGGGSGGPPPVGPFGALEEPSNPANFETDEYHASWGLAAINASSVYGEGAYGTGVIVAVIDTGIDEHHPEFEGAIHPASIEIVTMNGDFVQDPDGHGTAVAGIVGARRDNVGMHGVAFESSLLVIRADSGCLGGCVFLMSDVAKATDYAVNKGAAVINYSLGGEGSSATLDTALADAAAAGRILVFAAGNEGGKEGGENPLYPASFAASEAARGRAIAVGALDENGEIAHFSNRAGSAKDVFLVAPGVDVLVPKLGGGHEPWRGTSLAAPHVSGAAALIWQLWPHLDPSDVVAILLDTAADLGDPEIYGRGRLDLDAALSPQGVLSLPAGQSGTSAGPALAATALRLPSAFSVALARHPALSRAVALDRYGREFGIDLRRRVDSAPSAALASWLLRDPGHAITRPPAAEPWPGTAFRLWQGRGIEARTPGADLPHLPLGRALDSPHLALVARGDGVGIAQRAGAYTLGLSFAREALPADGPLGATTRDAVALDLGREHGGAAIGLQLGVVRERGGLLGARGGGAFAFDGTALTRFVTVQGRLPLGALHGLSARASLGHTDAGASGPILTEVGALTTSAFGLALDRRDLLVAGDLAAVAVSRPLRVDRGRAVLDVPVGRDNSGIVHAHTPVSLEPPGHGIDIELGYARPWLLGRLVLAGIVQLSPGHEPQAAPVLTLGLAYRRSF